ncbi:MAG: chemosensory pili system protein ChpA (sensor histidine kinase/response regulator) [Lysobacterales bacterium]|jgi:chemosensory pili system protein ChpA (sensor histidine kinase/response regulator)
MIIEGSNSSTALRWVREDLDKHVDQVRSQVENVARNPNVSNEAIGETASHIEFLKFTFEALTLNGAAMVADEMMTLCDRIKHYRVDSKQNAFSALMDAIVVIPSYLDRLQAGHQDLPILLLPVINELRTAHNASLLQESTVFAPDLDVELPELKVDDQQSTREEPFSDFAQRMRQQYENALLNWLQEQDVVAHLSPLQGICETLLHRCVKEEQRRLWWVASEVIGGLVEGYAKNDVHLRRLFARLHLNLKALSEGGEEVTDSRAANSLTKAFLFHVAHSRAGNAGIDLLKEHYQLADLVPDQEELLRAKGSVTGRDRDMYTSLGSALEDELSLVKDALDLELRTGQIDATRRANSTDALSRLQDALKMLGLIGPARALEELLPAFVESENADAEVRESSLMSLASQLLMIESALKEQIETLGEPLQEEEDKGFIDLPPHAQRRIRDRLLEEMVVSLHEFQEAVKARFSGDAKADLNEPLQQVAGALHMIDEQETANLTIRLANITAFLLRHAFSESAVTPAYLESFTNAVAALEIFLAACRDQQSNRERFVHILKESLDALPESDETAEHLAIKAAELAAAEKQERANRPPSLIETVEAEPGAGDHLPPEMDTELLEVFLEEYESVAESLNHQIPMWLERLDNSEHMKEIRRGFHTLKGSGHMVGAHEMGDFCWQIENLLNSLMEKKISKYADVAVMVRLAQAALPALKQRLMQQKVGLSQEAIVAIGKHAERLTRGEDADWTSLHQQLPAFLAGMVPGAPDPTLARSPIPARSKNVDEKLHASLLKDLAENLAHLNSLLDQVSSDRDSRVLREHLRAIHTIAGALSMAPEGLQAGIAKALEGMLDAQSNSGLPFGIEAIWALGSAIEHLQARLNRLEGDSTALAPEDEQGLINQILALTVELESFRLPDDEMPVFEPPFTEAGNEKDQQLEEQKSVEDIQAAEAEFEQSELEDSVTEEWPADEEELTGEIVTIFLEEAHEVLARSDTLLNTWRDNLAELNLVQNLQREIHTFKGGARMAGLSVLGDLSHEMESLLEKIAEKSLPPSVSAIQALEKGCDQLQVWVGQVEQGIRPEPGGAIELFEQRSQDLVNVPVQLQSVSPAAEEERESKALPEVAAPQTNRSDEKSSGQIRVDAELLDSLVNAAGEVSIFRSRMGLQIGNLRTSLGEFDDTIARLREQFRKLEIETEAQIRSRFQETSDAGNEDFDPLELDRFSSIQQLSRGLSESVSDLLNLQEILEDAARQSDNMLTQQSRFTTELQEGLMKTRMVPFGSVAPRLRRLVRSAAQETGKKARLQLKMIGTSDQLDRNVLQRITAPLEHMLRNSIAHGIERPAERKKLNKEPEGEITVTVESEATEFIIRIKDDGGGINLAAIRKKAIELNMIDKNADPAPQQLYEFILDSGFSTSSSVTGLAGRGVGMDVVNSEIKQIGGSLEIESEDGKGTCFTIRIPFTLAVMQAIGVMAGDNRYLIPLASVAGVARVTPDEYVQILESQEPVYEFAGNQYPVLELEALLGEPVHPLGSDNISLLLIKAGDQQAALRVPELLGHREIVIKPVGPQISSVPGILGGTVNADGKVLVILDSGPLIRHAMIHGTKPGTPATLIERPGQTLVMVVDDSITMRKVTSRVLESHDYEVATAKDGIDATEQLQDCLPDLLLLDIEMPRMDGFELATYVRSDPRLRHIPIIMITSRSGQKHRDRAAEVGANSYLTKPYKESELISEVREVLGQEV